MRVAGSVKSVELPNRARLPYVEQGDPSGVPVLLLTGYADSWHSFVLVLPHLPKSIRAFVLTQRGHSGASAAPRPGIRPATSRPIWRRLWMRLISGQPSSPAVPAVA